MIKPINALLSFCGGVAVYFFGPWNECLAALLCAVVIDYITGIISAAVTKTLNSRTGFTGILKKIFIFMVVALAALVDRAVPSANCAVRSTVCIFYIANEAISIIENAGKAGLPLPKFLKEAVERLSESSDINNTEK